MFRRGSFRYPYIVRLMGAGSQLGLASQTGFGYGERNKDGIATGLNSPYIFPCGNVWLLGSKFDPPWSTYHIPNIPFYALYGLSFLFGYQWYLYLSTRLILVYVLARFTNVFNIPICKINRSIDRGSSIFIVGKIIGIGNPFFYFFCVCFFFLYFCVFFEIFFLFSFIFRVFSFKFCFFYL